MVNEVVLKKLKKWIKTNTEPFEDITLIGSGGNINKLFKLSEKQQDKPLSYVYVASIPKLNSMTYEQKNCRNRVKSRPRRCNYSSNKNLS